MSECVQITLIICVSVIILCIISCSKTEKVRNKESSHLPNYPPPPRPGVNQPTTTPKPGIPGSKPPSIGSSVQKD